MENIREKISFNSGWKFKEGDEHLTPPPLKDVIYLGAKTERELRGYASKDYGKNREMAFENWESVTLPHDFIIKQEPKKEFNNTLGYFDYKNAWYRKTFRIEKSDRDKRLVIYFEGVATHATVYLNGCLMAHNFCGYTGFEVDITDMVKFGEDNVIAVYVNTTDKHEGWWYSGGGIFRNVWLIKTQLVSVDSWGVFVHPYATPFGWKIPIDVTLRNDDVLRHRATVSTEIFRDGGTEPVAVSESKGIYINGKDKNELKLEAFLEKPELWSCDHPNLYKAVVRVQSGRKDCDTYQVTFGFRTIEFDADHGFFLNGEPVKIKGVCCHEDYGLQGKAVSDSVKQLRLERLREMGANAYRTAHYPHSEYTFDCLARLGFLIMAETRWFESTKEGLEQLDFLIKSQRNNPAVIMWSLGNEEPYHTTPMGRRIFVTMRERAKRFDNTRPFTTAVSHDPAHAAVMNEVDLIGINYNLKDYDDLHKKFPNKMIFASECCAVGSTRGWTYDDCPTRGYLHCYDNRTGWFMSREATWKHIMAREWLGGGFQWAGIEHRGETEWPRLCSQSGALDLFLQKKDAFYENKAHWTDEPMVHILPHWNLPDRVGEKVWVWVYTNCEKVELYQDGNLLGTAELGKYDHAEFWVEYHPGRLEAKGYSGSTVCNDIVETTGAPVALELELQNKHPLKKWDTAVFNCYALDSEGRRVPDASPFISFYGNSNTSIVGTGSDICDHVPVPCPDRRMRAGIASVCVKLNGGDTLKLYANADGLKPASFTMEIK